MNTTATNVDQVRNRLSEIIGTEVNPSTTVFPPFYTNFGRSIRLGKNVFINHACSFLDIGGITIDDDVMVGPRVNLTSENHPIDPTDRPTVIPRPIVIKRNAWIGAGATILPGVTIGESPIVAAGAVVSRNVPSNTVRSNWRTGKSCQDVVKASGCRGYASAKAVENRLPVSPALCLVLATIYPRPKQSEKHLAYT
ncbi:hypothetical protein ACFSUS_14475 [Spirosoma soli]|uniref:Sugar O-acetyltransferase n=1 Tax=Spirosoma soli TaxID=1770529 RepID=A0ABW5M5Q1_9BACT